MAGKTKKRSKMAGKTIIVIDADSVHNWDRWNQTINEHEVQEIEENEDFLNMIRGRDVVAVVEDRFGWDFIWRMNGGILIGDRNSQSAQYVKTTKIDLLIGELKRLTDGQEIPYEGSVWQKRIQDSQAA